MAYSVEYFHAKVQASVETWPVDVVADYARIIELLVWQRVVILHAFIKKSQETPVPEIKIARKRMKEVQNG
ncbi:bacteriophage protein [mine drainage metagenome]|uniref:Bacteriophage protein n=1 Tax=mine drainage metagenome TaxID=410659 RepID=T0ZKV2_9ZZZZ